MAKKDDHRDQDETWEERIKGLSRGEGTQKPAGDDEAAPVKPKPNTTNSSGPRKTEDDD